MLTFSKAICVGGAFLTMLFGYQADQSSHGTQADYTAEGQMRLPADYRTWVFLTSGFDMSYVKGASEPDHHMFDNVFVNPESYKAFLTTGHWPDKTTFVLELRGAEAKVSINQRGHSQQTSIMATEVHVHDAKRFAATGGWAFFSFEDGAKTGKMFEPSASCYTCHQAHAAVDTTFVQFYPTLLPVATDKGTLSDTYKKETKEPE